MMTKEQRIKNEVFSEKRMLGRLFLLNKPLATFSFLAVSLIVPRTALAHTGGVMAIATLFSIVYVWGAILIFAGIPKFFLTNYLFRHKVVVSKEVAFRINLAETTVYTVLFFLLLFMNIRAPSLNANAFITNLGPLGSILYGMSISHGMLFLFMSMVVLTFPVYYPVTLFLNSRLFTKKTATVGTAGKWKFTCLSALIMPTLVILLSTLYAATSLKSLDDLLIETSSTGNTGMAEVLIKRGANVNARDKNNNSALFLAFAFGRLAQGRPKDMIKLLIDNGADINSIEDSTGTTLAIKASAHLGRLEEFKEYLDRKPNLNAINDKGDTVLSVALWTKQMDKVDLLIEKGVNIDMKNSYGRTALMEMAMHGNLEGAKFLIEKQADIHVKDDRGRTALRLAAISGHQEIAALLLSHGGNPTER
jgi:ankyrin repeat protein